jgi:hypothetical protein
MKRDGDVRPALPGLSTVLRRAWFVILSGHGLSQIITIEPDKRSGKPCIRGTRMTVTDVLEYLAGGMTQEELLADFQTSPSRTFGLASLSPPTGRNLATLPE